MNTLSIEAKNAQKAHTEADQKGKSLLENLFGKQIFQINVIDRFKTFEDVLKHFEITVDEFYEKYAKLESDEIAYIKLKLIAEALNGDWTPDWTDSKQYKYFPYFNNASSSVGGFSYDDYGNWDTFTTVGSRLCFQSAELAKYAGTQFLNEYNEFLSL
jgi:hypothetical protein